MSTVAPNSERIDRESGELLESPAPPTEARSELGFITRGEPKELAKLYAKMSAVLGDIERVRKAGNNTQQSYRYTTAADLLDEVRPLLAKHGIAFFPSVVHTDQQKGTTKSGAVKTITHVILQTAFCCTETGAMLVSTWHGEAEDTGDKSYWKAYTGTLKYAHFQTWMVSTGDDPEEEGPAPGGGDRQQSAQPARAPTKPAPRATKPVARPVAEKSERSAWHTRLLGTINERRKLLPDGVACTVGKSQTGDLKAFIGEHWEQISKNVDLAKRAAAAVDAALKSIEKPAPAAAGRAKRETAEERMKRLNGRYFALIAEKHGTVHDADRHAFQEAVTGKASSNDWTAEDFETATKAVLTGRLAEFALPM